MLVITVIANNHCSTMRWVISALYIRGTMAQRGSVIGPRTHSVKARIHHVQIAWLHSPNQPVDSQLPEEGTRSPIGNSWGHSSLHTHCHPQGGAVCQRLRARVPRAKEWLGGASRKRECFPHVCHPMDLGLAPQAQVGWCVPVAFTVPRR